MPTSRRRSRRSCKQYSRSRCTKFGRSRRGSPVCRKFSKKHCTSHKRSRSRRSRLSRQRKSARRSRRRSSRKSGSRRRRSSRKSGSRRRSSRKSGSRRLRGGLYAPSGPSHKNAWHADNVVVSYDGVMMNVPRAEKKEWARIKKADKDAYKILRAQAKDLACHKQGERFSPLSGACRQHRAQPIEWQY